MTRIGIALCALFALPLRAQHEAHPAGGLAHERSLGTVVFPSSANAAAQRPFLRGVALLHSYEYADAAAAFREAIDADPAFALGYWMEALTYSHIDWRQENLAASRAVLARLGATPAARLARARNERERRFGAAVEAFYMEGTQALRVRAYADSLRAYARTYAADVEAQAFASHAIMLAGVVAASRAERDSLYQEAVLLSQKVLTRQPSHPGATHYLIHLYDSPGMAKHGLEFARAYDKIAPDAEHALHMPSHIYLQLGMWADVVKSNERAWAASRAINAPSWHTLAWLQYGYLELRRFEDARALIDSARAIAPTLAGYDADGAMIVPRLEFQYAAATGKWTQPLTQPPSPRGEMSEREAGFRRAAAYWSAVDAAMRNDSAGIARYANAFFGRQDASALVVQALVARARTDRQGFMRLLRAAAAEESQLEPFVGPPERLFASELLGAELNSRGQGAEAAALFENVLRLCPGRTEAVDGLARAKKS